MTGKIAMMTGLAFTFGVVVGVLFHLPGTTSPSTYRTGFDKERYGSPRILNAWREGLSSGENQLAGGQYSSNSDRRRNGSGFRSDSGIPGIVLGLKRMPEPWEDSVNTDYNDKGFIHSRNKPRSNNSESANSAVIGSYHNMDSLAAASLLNVEDTAVTTTTRSGGGKEKEVVRSKIMSVLKDIRVVQLETDSLLNDIAKRRSQSGIDLDSGYSNEGVPVQRTDSRYDSIKSRKSEEESSNILDEIAAKGTPMDNNVRNNRAREAVGLGESTQGELPSDRQLTDNRVRPSEDQQSKPVDIVSGVFWSEELENLCPKGFRDEVYDQWREKMADTSVVAVTEGCGRMQNRRLTFRDSSTACARYRPNTDQIQGEIYSYYLSRLLRINNVPPSILVPVRVSDKIWAGVGREIAMSHWGEDKLVVLTKWIDGLEPAYIPAELRGMAKSIHPHDVQLLNKSISELCELVQWSDLIMFDYLTANLDRIVNNMFNQQWNSQMMSFPAHNLHKIKDSNILVFLDNESGLFHGYRLLDKYSKYHEEYISSLCVFRERTVREIERLFLDDSLERELNQLLNSNESQEENLPPMPDKNIQILKQRLQDVYEQIQKCQRITQR
ncbi:four-jointed box protein 1-like [Liolophura sinensis]|uniref:four-jointed box protein 1-like n=1 Tax=Liolophura sinensis TaxID=3198878 RepID=UPI00315924D2